MRRRQFIKKTALALPAAGLGISAMAKSFKDLPDTPRVPALFTSHGNPMEMLAEPNSTPFFKSLRDVSRDIQNNFPVKAVLIISAHWLTRGTFINNAPFPETIHDFSGFPEHFYEARYPSPGSPEMAVFTSEITGAGLTDEWGYDHGSWPVLRHYFPKAEMPVYQMSIDYYQPASYHFELGKKISVLRSKGVMIIGSGSVVHNLREGIPAMINGIKKPIGWEYEFDDWVKDKLDQKDFQALINYEKHPLGLKASPTPDHYVPMLYTLGAADPGEKVTHTFEELLPAFSNRGFRIG